MDLHPTWDGLTGPNIHYIVEYRVSGTIPWIVAASNVHANFYDILGIPDNFYDVRISHVCANVTVNTTYLNAGKSACAEPEFVSYVITEDSTVQQKVTITFIAPNPNIKVRMKRLNDGEYVLDQLDTSAGTYDFILPKSATEALTYRIEIGSVCAELESQYVVMGDYTVQRVTNGLKLSYIDNCTCDGKASFVYSRQDTTGTYTNPVSIPRGIYNIYVTIPGGSCSFTQQLSLKVVVLQGVSEILSDTILANKIDGFYVFPFSSINMKNGLHTGQFPTETQFTITCG